VLDDIVEINNAFRLIGPANSGSVTLVCPSAEDKASWMKDITNAIAGTIVSADPDGSEESWRQEQQSDAEQPASASSSSSSLPMVAGGRTSVQLSGPPSLSVIETDVAPRRERRSGPVLNRSSRCWQGYLLKQEGSFVKIWERRWVVLGQDGTLFLYKDKGNTTPLRSLNLPSLVLTGVFRTSDRAFYYLNFDPKPFKDGILEGLMGFAATKGAPMASVQIGSFSKEMMQLWVYVFRKHLNIDPECLQSTQMDFSNPPPSLVVDSAGGVISVRKAGGADHLLHPIDSDASLKSPQKPQASQEQQQQQHPDLNAGDDDDDEPDTTSQPASARSTPQRSPSVVTASAIGAEQQILVCCLRCFLGVLRYILSLDHRRCIVSREVPAPSNGECIGMYALARERENALAPLAQTMREQVLMRGAICRVHVGVWWLHLHLGATRVLGSLVQVRAYSHSDKRDSLVAQGALPYATRRVRC